MTLQSRRPVHSMSHVRMKMSMGIICINMIRNTRLILLVCLTISTVSITFFATQQTSIYQYNGNRILANDVIRTQPPTKGFMEIQAKIQKGRIQHIHETCKAYGRFNEGPISKDTLEHIYVNHNIKGLYCFVPKVACSNWKRVLMVLNGYPRAIDEITGWEAHENNGLTLLSTLPDDEQHAVLANYTKFMVAREPFLRILSAYKNKFENSEEYNSKVHFQYYGKMIMRRYRPNPTNIELATGRGIRWTEFTAYLTDPFQRLMFENHWQEINTICSPCKINYDYLAKLETIQEDAKFILRSFNVSDLVMFPNAYNSAPTDSKDKYYEYYDQLTLGTIKKLWNIYQFDFELFGYSKPNLF